MRMIDVDAAPQSHSAMQAPSHLAAMSQARNAYRATLVLAAVIVPTAPIYILLGLASAVWQISALGLVVAGLSVCVIAGVRMCRRGESRRGIRLTLGALAIALVINSTLIAQFGLVSGVLLVILSVVIGVQSLPVEDAPRIVIAIAVLSFLAGLIDLLAPPWQYVIPGLSTFILTVICLVLLIYSLLIVRQFKSYPLRSKLTFIFFAVSLASLAVLGFAGNHAFGEALTHEAQQTLFERAAQTADDVDTFIHEQTTAVQSAAQTPLLVSALAGDVQNRPDVTALLQALQQHSDVHIVSYTLLDDKGQVRSSGAQMAESEALGRYSSPFASAFQFVSAPQLGGERALLFFVSPIVDAGGQTSGALSAAYDAGVLQAIIETGSLSGAQAATAILFDENGIVLAYSNRPDLRFHAIAPLNDQQARALQAQRRLPNQPIHTLDDNFSDLKRALAKATPESNFSVDLLREQDASPEAHFAVRIRLETQPWSLVFAQPQGRFVQSVETYARSILFIALASVSLVGVAASFIAQVLAGPLVRLTDVAARVSEGDLGARARIESADEIGALAATFNEMTQRLQQTMDGLAQHVEELKQTHEQLKAYSAELERSNRDLQSFASIASHDLNEPLRKIKTFSERLVAHHDTDLNPQARDYLLRMQNAVLRMQTLIENLLAYSRVTTMGEAFRPVDLSDIVHGVLADLEIRIEQSGARVQVGDLPTLYADPTQMRQLMQNLISNALKFHRSDEPPEVRIDSVFIPVNGYAGARGDVFQISVTDNGIGIEEKYLDHIFHLFQRLHPRSEYEGTGIGLAICRRIIEWHGGVIVAQSTPGQGSVFIITLPAHPANAMSSAPAGNVA